MKHRLGLLLLAPLVLSSSMQAVVVGAWNPNNDNAAVSSNLDLSSLNTASFTRLVGQNTDGGNYLTYQQFGQVAVSGTAPYDAVNSNLYIGASLVSNAVDGYKLREARFRIRNTSPDVLQLLTETDQAEPFTDAGLYSGLYALELTPGTTLSELSSISHHSSGNRTVRYWAELDGGAQIVSESFNISGGLNNYIFDYTAETWLSWIGAGNFDSTGGNVADSDFSWAKSVGGAAAALDGTEVVTKFGFTWEVSDLSDGWSTNTTVINAVPEPSMAAWATGLLSMVWVVRRRRP